MRSMSDILKRPDGTQAPLIDAVAGYWASAKLRAHELGEHFELRNSNLPSDLRFVPNVAEHANFATDFTGFADEPNAEFVDVVDSNNVPTLRLALQLVDAGQPREGMVLVKYGAEHKPGNGLPSTSVYGPEDKLLLCPLPRKCISTEELSYWEANDVLTQVPPPAYPDAADDKDDQRDDQEDNEGDEDEEEDEEEASVIGDLAKVAQLPRRARKQVTYVNMDEVEPDEGDVNNEDDDAYEEEQEEEEEIVSTPKRKAKTQAAVSLLSVSFVLRRHPTSRFTFTGQKHLGGESKDDETSQGLPASFVLRRGPYSLVVPSQQPKSAGKGKSPAAVTPAQAKKKRKAAETPSPAAAARKVLHVAPLVLRRSFLTVLRSHVQRSKG